MRCWFLNCKWDFVCVVASSRNVPSNDLRGPIGLWQCRYCKALSIGKIP